MTPGCSAGQIGGGVCDGELAVLRLPTRARDMAVRAPGPDGPGYR